MASGRIVSIAKDQEGSRFIQQRLECADQDEIQLVFDEAIAANIFLTINFVTVVSFAKRESSTTLAHVESAK